MITAEARNITLISGKRDNFIPDFIGNGFLSFDCSGDERPPIAETEEVSEDAPLMRRRADKDIFLCDLLLRNDIGDDLGGAVVKAAYYGHAAFMPGDYAQYLVSANNNLLPASDRDLIIPRTYVAPIILTYAAPNRLVYVQYSSMMQTTAYSPDTAYEPAAYSEQGKTFYMAQPEYRMSGPRAVREWRYSRIEQEYRNPDTLVESRVYLPRTAIPELPEIQIPLSEPMVEHKRDGRAYSPAEFEAETAMLAEHRPKDYKLELLAIHDEPLKVQKYARQFDIRDTAGASTNELTPTYNLPESRIADRTITRAEPKSLDDFVFTTDLRIADMPLPREGVLSTAYSHDRTDERSEGKDIQDYTYLSASDSLITQIPPYIEDTVSTMFEKDAVNYEAEPTIIPFRQYRNFEETRKENKKREDLCASKPTIEEIVYPCGGRKNYRTARQREDLCAVIPTAEEIDLKDLTGYDTSLFVKTRRREDLCAVRPEVIKQKDREMYRLVLENTDYVSHGRAVRVEEDGRVITIYTKGTLLEKIDALLELNGLVGEYRFTKEGLYLAGIKGLENVQYILKVTDTETGARRYLRQSIDKEADSSNLEVAVEFFKLGNACRDLSFDSRYFSQIFNWRGDAVKGAAELLRFTVTEAEANDYSIAIVEKITTTGETVTERVRRNSHDYLVHSHLLNNGFTPVYETIDVIKHGRKIGTDSYLKDVLYNGVSVMKLTGNNGYLNEIVDSLGQRSEPLARDGITALAPKGAIGIAGQGIAVVGMYQGAYDRRETHIKYQRRQAA